ncbi:MAG: precorrin-6A/cobalt-precorrin-6A reductase [Clostridium fessum]
MTKDSGRAGGFQEKVEAARENGTRVVVIRRPEEMVFRWKRRWRC